MAILTLSIPTFLKPSIKFPGVNGTNATSVFDYNYSSTGLSEESCKAFRIPHAVSYIEDNDRPEFMKSVAKVSFKIVYCPKTLKLIGAQIGSRGANHAEVMYAFSLALIVFIIWVTRFLFF